MKRLLPALFFASAVLALGADWLSVRGDPQNSGWQRGEKYLTVGNVGRLHLLWQRKLSDTPNSLTDPLILGPIITERGIKELVFVQDTAGSVYAIDADLGRIFWHRSLGSPSACPGGRPVQPTMEPSPNSNALPDNSGDDSFSDANHPLYALTANGRVFPLRPSSGKNLSPSFPFLRQGVFPVRMEALGNTLSATTSKTCGGVANASWHIPVGATGVPSGQAAPAEAELTESPVEFTWGWRPWRAAVDQTGQPRIAPASDTKQQSPRPVAKLATWEDEEATRWIYTAIHNQLAAFRLAKGNAPTPTVKPSWRLSNLTDPGPPVVANGIVYFLSKTGPDGSLVLRALDAKTGQDLYTSKDAITSRASSENLAIANGDICFSTADSQTYCFGLPFKP